MPMPRSVTVQVGQVLARRYRIQRLIGEGAVGAVFAAEDLERGGLVAIKVLKSIAGIERVAMERFRREIEATRRLECAYIARTLGVGYLDSGVPFMVMEHYEATDLSKIVLDKGPLELEKAITFGLQICLALAHAHRIGIVHRDIKPANILVVRDAQGHDGIKVLDFGVSKIVNDESVSSPFNLTGKEVRLGSPMYMSPEQRTTAWEVDERTDIWSLGITLFEIMTGVPPFDSSPKSIRGRWEAPSSVPSLSRHRLGIPKELDRVIARCLQRMPDARFQNIAELANALAWFVRPEVARMSADVARALGPPRFHTPLLEATSALGGGFETVPGHGTTLGPAVTEGPATVRVASRRNRAVVGILGTVVLGLALSAAAARTLGVKSATAIPVTSLTRLPVPAAWTARARSFPPHWVNSPSFNLAAPAPIVNASTPSAALGLARRESLRAVGELHGSTSTSQSRSEESATPDASAEVKAPRARLVDMGY